MLKHLLSLAFALSFTAAVQAADDPGCLERDSGGPLDRCERDTRTGGLKPVSPRTHVVAENQLKDAPILPTPR